MMEEKDVIQTLQSSIAQLDSATLQATLAYLLKVYVIDKDLAYAGVGQDAAAPAFRAALNIEPPANFFELMSELKRQYSLPELKLFSLEGGKVYITLNGTRYQITAERAEGAGTGGLQTAADRGAGGRPRPSEAGSRQEAGGRTETGSDPASGSTPAAGAKPARTDLPADGTITPHRFKNLEMDD